MKSLFEKSRIVNGYFKMDRVQIGSWFETYNSLQRMNRLTKEMNYWLGCFLSYTGMSKDQLAVFYFVGGNNLREVVSLNLELLEK
jgi:hypothetical protein